MADSPADLFAAIQAGDADRLQELLDEDPARAAVRHASGATPLMFTLYMRRPDLADIVRASLPSLDLYEAAAIGDEIRVEGLLRADAGAARAWSPDGFTALHFAAFFGRLAIVRRLLAAGADPAAVSRNDMRVQPLHSAVSARANDIAALLLQAGAPADAAQQKNWTALMSAGVHGDEELVDLLLAHGASRDFRDDEGRTASDMAMEKGHLTLAKKLRS